jgi:hypothetical protein
MYCYRTSRFFKSDVDVAFDLFRGKFAVCGFLALEKRFQILFVDIAEGAYFDEVFMVFAEPLLGEVMREIVVSYSKRARLSIQGEGNRE